MPLSKLGKLLLAENIVAPDDLDTLEKHSSYHSAALAKGVIALGLSDDERLAAIIADKTEFDRAPADLVAGTSMAALEKLDTQLMARFDAVPLKIEKDRLAVALVDPTDQLTIRQIEFFSGLKVKPVIASLSQIRRALSRLISGFKPFETSFEILLKKARLAEENPTEENQEQTTDDTPQESTDNPAEPSSEQEETPADKPLDLDTTRSDEGDYEEFSLEDEISTSLDKKETRVTVDVDFSDLDAIDGDAPPAEAPVTEDSPAEDAPVSATEETEPTSNDDIMIADEPESNDLDTLLDSTFDVTPEAEATIETSETPPPPKKLDEPKPVMVSAVRYHRLTAQVNNAILQLSIASDAEAAKGILETTLFSLFDRAAIVRWEDANTAVELIHSWPQEEREQINTANLAPEVAKINADAAAGVQGLDVMCGYEFALATAFSGKTYAVLFWCDKDTSDPLLVNGLGRLLRAFARKIKS